MEFCDISPVIGSNEVCKLFQPVNFKVKVTKCDDWGLDDLVVDLWTNIPSHSNDELPANNNWHSVRMIKSANSRDYYTVTEIPCRSGIFEFTFRAKRECDSDFSWPGGMGQNGVVEIHENDTKPKLDIKPDTIKSFTIQYKELLSRRQTMTSSTGSSVLAKPQLNLSLFVEALLLTMANRRGFQGQVLDEMKMLLSRVSWLTQGFNAKRLLSWILNDCTLVEKICRVTPNVVMDYDGDRQPLSMFHSARRVSQTQSWNDINELQNRASKEGRSLVLTAFLHVLTGKEPGHISASAPTLRMRRLGSRQSLSVPDSSSSITQDLLFQLVHACDVEEITSNFVCALVERLRYSAIRAERAGVIKVLQCIGAKTQKPSTSTFGGAPAPTTRQHSWSSIPFKPDTQQRSPMQIVLAVIESAFLHHIAELKRDIDEAILLGMAPDDEEDFQQQKTAESSRLDGLLEFCKDLVSRQSRRTKMRMNKRLSAPMTSIRRSMSVGNLSPNANALVPLDTDAPSFDLDATNSPVASPVMKPLTSSDSSRRASLSSMSPSSLNGLRRVSSTTSVGNLNAFAGEENNGFGVGFAIEESEQEEENTGFEFECGFPEAESEISPPRLKLGRPRSLSLSEGEMEINNEIESLFQTSPGEEVNSQDADGDIYYASTVAPIHIYLSLVKILTNCMHNIDPRAEPGYEQVLKLLLHISEQHMFLKILLLRRLLSAWPRDNALKQKYFLLLVIGVLTAGGNKCVLREVACSDIVERVVSVCLVKSISCPHVEIAKHAIMALSKTKRVMHNALTSVGLWLAILQHMLDNVNNHWNTAVGRLSQQGAREARHRLVELTKDPSYLTRKDVKRDILHYKNVRMQKVGLATPSLVRKSRPLVAKNLSKR